jgi:hypothetical protein
MEARSSIFISSCIFSTIDTYSLSNIEFPFI